MATTQKRSRFGNPAISNPERIERMWQLSPVERQAAFRRGEFSLAEISRCAARYPLEFELVNGEFWHIALLLADVDDD